MILILTSVYGRYEDLFDIDASKLADAAKVRVLLRRMNIIVHNNKYIHI